MSTQTVMLPETPAEAKSGGGVVLQRLVRAPFHESPNHMLYHADCLELLETAPDAWVDAIVTDPPFAMTGGISNGVTAASDSQFFEHWLVDVLKQCIRVVKPEGCMFFWCDWRTAAVLDRALARASIRYEPWSLSQMIVHDREMIGMGKPFRNQCDWIAVVRGLRTDWKDRVPNNTPNIFREYSYYGKHDNHPSEKTVTAAERLVKWAAEPGGTVLDPFCGSATTLVACKHTGRFGVGIERDETHVATAKRRCEQDAMNL